MPVYKLLIEYDGSPFNGWQIQPGMPTVQESLESAIAIALGERAQVVGSGRTDTGVHARGQVAHFSVKDELDPYRLLRALNGILDDSVAILDVSRASDDFHARYDARARIYRYFVSTCPRVLDAHARVEVRPAPDFDVMNRAAAQLIGTHEFSAFCRTRSETRNRMSTVSRARWNPETRRGDWYFEIAADRFLHGMVRAIVGTLIRVGHKKWPWEHVADILASGDRRKAGPAAPARGLVLEEVIYGDTGN